jgi:hypothetical protein
MPPDAPHYLTPPELAKLWRVSPEKIIAMIRGGQLAAVNLASRGSSRPRFRISRDAIRNFEQGQVPIPKATPGPRRQSKADCTLKRFI